MLHAVRNIGNDVEGISVSQIVIDSISLWDRTVVLNRVDVIISSADTQLRI